MVKFTGTLYDKDGYFTPRDLIPWCLKNKIFRCTVIGGRGTGKSIGTLMYLLKSGIYFAYSRRYAAQIQLVASKQLSPLRAVNRNLGTDYTAHKVEKDIWGVYHAEYTEDGKPVKKPIGDELGLFIPLSTGVGLRGFDGLDIKVWVSDEIVPDPNERTLANEGEGYRSLYETINRNREDYGEPPLLLLAYGNSNRVATPFTVEFGYIPHLVAMKEAGQKFRLINGNEVLILLDDSPLKEKKAQQAAYARGGKYADMAVDNDFIDDHFSKIRYINNRELVPYYKLGDLYISAIKSGGFYVSLQNPGGAPKEYKGDRIGVEKFRHQHSSFIIQYWNEQVIFSEELAESLLQEYFRIM